MTTTICCGDQNESAVQALPQPRGAPGRCGDRLLDGGHRFLAFAVLKRADRPIDTGTKSAKILERQRVDIEIFQAGSPVWLFINADNTGPSDIA